MFDFKSHKARLLAAIRTELGLNTVTVNVNLSGAESRNCRSYHNLHQIPKDALRHGTIHHLYGTQLIFDDRPKLDDFDFTPPVKDFSKAKTKKDKLASQLTNKKKAKVSPLLAKLVSKK